MNREARFQEMLEEICGLAKVNGNRISKSLVEQFFQEMELTKEQFQMIYEYFSGKKILVEDQIQEGMESQSRNQFENPIESPGKNRMEDFQEEVEFLCLKVLKGDKEAKNRLIGLYLDKVVEIANSYANEAILMEDLIQEGNLGLVLGLEELDQKGGGLTFDDFLKQKIHQGILDALEEEYQVESAEEELENKVNDFHRKVLALGEELERKPSLEEVCLYVKMPEEEVKGLFRMMGEEVED